MNETYIRGYHERGYLPHRKQKGAFYFVTFRLTDSLPRDALEKWEADLSREFPENDAEANDERTLERRRRIERALDSGIGACWLKRPDLADLVASSLRYFDGDRYELPAWVVMPNHVHVVVRPAKGVALGDVVKSWKAFSGLRANRLIGLGEGRFWQPESYDRWIRDGDEYVRIVRYVENNPVKARLCARPEAWKWSSAFRRL